MNVVEEVSDEHRHDGVADAEARPEGAAETSVDRHQWPDPKEGAGDDRPVAGPEERRARPQTRWVRPS